MSAPPQFPPAPPSAMSQPPPKNATTLVMESNEGEWSCTGGTLPTDMRTPRCRTGISTTY